MASEKDAERQGSDEEDDDSSEDFPEGGEEIEDKKSSSLTGALNAKIAALAIAGVVIGILVGQIALPGLGVGLIAMPASNGGDSGNAPVDMAALQAKVQGYIQEAVRLDQPGLDVKVTSIESYNKSFYTVNFDILNAGEVQNSSMVLLTKDGLALVGAQPMMLDEPLAGAQGGTQDAQGAAPAVVGTFETFNDSGYEVELQDGKPVIRLFSTTWCLHCQWIKETFDSVAKEYVDAGKIVAHHWEIDTLDDTLTEAVETAVPDLETAVYKRFNPRGSIPTFVLGGKYYRVGNGFEQEQDLAKEEAALRAVIDKLVEEAKQ